MSETIRRETDETTIFTIGFKLVTIVAIITLISLILVTVLIFGQVRQETRITAENNNIEVNRNAAYLADEILSKVLSDSTLLISMLNSSATDTSLMPKIVRQFYEENRHIAYILFKNDNEERHIVNNEFFHQRGIDVSRAASFLKNQMLSPEPFASGEAAVFNAAPHFLSPLLAIHFTGEIGPAAAIFSSEKLLDSFSSGTNRSWMINASGDILVHPNFRLTLENVNIADNVFFHGMHETAESGHAPETGSVRRTSGISYNTDLIVQIRDKTKYFFISFYGKLKNTFFLVMERINQKIIKPVIIPAYDSFIARCVNAINAVCTWFFSQFSAEWDASWHINDRNALLNETDVSPADSLLTESQITAFTGLNTAGCVVITGIEYENVFKGITAVIWRSIPLCAAILFLSMLIVWIYSKSISNPIKKLSAHARTVEGGIFNAPYNPAAGRDEIGVLTTSFRKMYTALGNFKQFGNRDTALQSMRGKNKNEGLQKHATILFTGIMGFTEISEKIANQFKDDASRRVFLWLNNYLTRMAGCVDKTNGNIDKFIGDTMLAHWGISYLPESPSIEAFNCIKAALMIRKTVYEMNKKRGKDDICDPHIRVSCGINSGIVTAGRLGAGLHAENTIIGDPVNLAARIETLNKQLKTDILISENTWSLVKNRIIAEELPPFKVKGMEKPQKIFAVVNFAGISKGPKTMSDVRRLLNIEEN